MYAPYGSVKLKDASYVGRDEVRALFVDQYFNSFAVMSACNRMYKRSFIIENEVFFSPLRRCQDMAYSLLLFDKVERLVTLEETFYCYVIEPGVYKGRAYSEMLDIYAFIYEKTSECFENWGRFDSNVKQKLTNNVCEQIANYSAYAFAVKYRDEWKKNTKLLLKDTRVKQLFSQYESRGSRFMKLFCLAVKIRSRVAMMTVSLMVEKAKHKGK